MQFCWKSGALWLAHPESLPWNTRLSCCAAALRSTLFSWQVFHFYLISVKLFFPQYWCMCRTSWCCHLFLFQIGVSPINNNKTSHFLNGIVIGAMSTLALALIAVLGFLWICLLSRKKSIGGNYVKMDKQTVPDGNESDTISYICLFKRESRIERYRLWWLTNQFYTLSRLTPRKLILLALL